MVIKSLCSGWCHGAYLTSGHLQPPWWRSSVDVYQIDANIYLSDTVLTPKPESYVNAKFVVTGDTGGCCVGKLYCHQWQLDRHYDNPQCRWWQYTVKPLIQGATNPKTQMFFVSSCSCLCHWSQVLSRELRCSWSSADTRCSNYIWVINNFIAY